MVLFRLTVKDLNELDELENVELRRFLAENNQTNLLENHSVALAEWINDRKLVFQGPSLDFVRIFPYDLGNGVILYRKARFSLPGYLVWWGCWL